MLRTRSSGSVQISSVDYPTLIKKLRTIALTIKKDIPAVKRIMLFGSFARKNYTPESDVDILVIMQHIDVPFLERRDILEPYFRDIPLDVNVIVYSEQEIHRLSTGSNTFIADVLEDSLEL
jgi:predicted nucleotidyltransferase